jgi:uncharacterized membrane protein
MTFAQDSGKNTTPAGQAKDEGAVPPAAASSAPEMSVAHDARSDGGDENERLLFFSDGIIAFTITLATISIRLSSGEDPAKLPELLRELLPNILTYGIAFVIVSSYWYEHWRIFGHIKRSNATFLILNFLFLASLVFLPFLAHFYGGNFYLQADPDTLNLKGDKEAYITITTLFFYTFLLLTGILLLLLWRYAQHKDRLIDKELPSSAVRSMTLGHMRVPLAIVVYLTAFVVFDLGILASFLPALVFLVIWEGVRRFFYAGAVAHKPTDTHRIIIFSDCVIAIAITLVAAQLELPQLKLGARISQAITGLAIEHLLLTLFIYLVAFLNIGIHWLSHYHMFRLIKRSNAWLVVLNFAFLLCISLLFLPTSAILLYDTNVAARFYYSAQTITALLLVLMWLYAQRKPRLLDAAADPAQVRWTTVRLTRNLLMFAAFAVLTFLLPISINIVVFFMAYLLVLLASLVLRRVWRLARDRLPLRV